MKKNEKVKSNPFTIGELNKLIDSLCHPLSKKDESFLLIDTFLHGLVEQSPNLTIRKFIRYNLPKLIKQLEKNSQTKFFLKFCAHYKTKS